MAVGYTNFPATIDTHETLLRLGLGTETFLLQPITEGMNTLVVADPSRLSAPSGVLLVGNEWITYGSVTGNVLSQVSRGQFQNDGGYPASAHPDGERVLQFMTPIHHRVLADAIIAIETLIGQGRLVDLADVQIGGLDGNESIFWDAAQQKWIAFVPYFGDQANTGALWSANDGQVVAWDDPTDQWIPVSATGIDGFTEAVQDVVGALIGDSASIDATYNDAGNLQSLAVIYGGTGAASTAARSDHNHNADSALVHPTGSIIMYGGAAAPTGWLLCDGSAVSRTTFAALFTAIGTAYGAGNGTTTFNLPNFKSRTPFGLDAAQTGNDALGETGGARTVTLTSAQSGIPAHNHGPGTLTTDTEPNHQHSETAYIINNNSQTPNNGSGNRVQSATETTPLTGAAGGHAHSITGGLTANNSAADAADAHENLPPFLTVNFIVKT